MERTNRRIKKTEKMENNCEDMTGLTNGRIPLSEISNITRPTKDRRKPELIRRVTMEKGKCIKRCIDEARSDKFKRCKESTGQTIQQTRVNIKSTQAKNTTKKDVNSLNHLHTNKTCHKSISQGISKLDLEKYANVSQHDTLTEMNKENISVVKTKTKHCQNFGTEGNTSSNMFHMSSQYCESIYEYLLGLEKKTKLVPNHLEGKSITGKMRQLVIDWLLEVQNHFRLCQETVELTITLMDHILATDSTVDHDSVQLVCLAAMFVAVKYEETFLLELSDLRYVCDYSYQESDILEMERRILKVVNFNLSHPTRTTFLGLLMHGMRENVIRGTIEEKMAKYLIDISLLEYTLASIEPSNIATACLYLSINVVRGKISESLPSLPPKSHHPTKEIIRILIKKATISTSINKGGIYNKHLRDNSKGSIRDLVQSQTYQKLLREISAGLEK